MLKSGEFSMALENFLLRAYIALEKVDLKKQQVTKNKFSEQLVKILKLMYSCVSLRPDYILDQTEQQYSDRSKKSSTRVKLDHKLLLNDIAKDIYMEELFNRGIDEKKREKKPDFEEFK